MSIVMAAAAGLLAAGSVGATGHEAPQGEAGAASGSSKVSGKVGRGVSVERHGLERSESVRELRRQLREHNRQWRAGTAARPTPVVSALTATSSPVQEEIIPAAIELGTGAANTLADDALVPLIQPPSSPSSASAAPSSTSGRDAPPGNPGPAPWLPRPLRPAAMNSAALTNAPPGAASTPLSTAGDPRLTEVERSLLRQQLRGRPQPSSERSDRTSRRH